jgi:hypothetical protein
VLQQQQQLGTRRICRLPAVMEERPDLCFGGNNSHGRAERWMGKWESSSMKMKPFGTINQCILMRDNRQCSGYLESDTNFTPANLLLLSNYPKIFLAKNTVISHWGEPPLLQKRQYYPVIGNSWGITG